jgi:phosphoribosylglycinamide formyltransferase-1
MPRVADRERVADICRALPEVTSSEEGRHVGFEVHGRRFAWFLDDHHGDGRIALNCKVPPGENASLAEDEPDRFFIPPYLGPRGWVGIWLDTPKVDWDRVEKLLRDSYRLRAPKRLVRALEG